MWKSTEAAGTDLVGKRCLIRVGEQELEALCISGMNTTKSRN